MRSVEQLVRLRCLGLLSRKRLRVLFVSDFSPNVSRFVRRCALVAGYGCVCLPSQVCGAVSNTWCVSAGLDYQSSASLYDIKADLAVCVSPYPETAAEVRMLGLPTFYFSPKTATDACYLAIHFLMVLRFLR